MRSQGVEPYRFDPFQRDDGCQLVLTVTADEAATMIKALGYLHISSSSVWLGQRSSFWLLDFDIGKWRTRFLL